jgi:soluble lytic murein transglycosylase-like protein
MPEETRFIEPWQDMMANEKDLPLSWRKGIYKGMVRGIQEAYPKTQDLPFSHIMGQMERESTMRPNVLGKPSPREQAVGLMQVKPSTAEWLAKREGVYPEGVDLFDSETNATMGILYLKYLKNRFGTLDAATQAYHVGPNAYARGKRSQEYLRGVKELSRGYK